MGPGSWGEPKELRRNEGAVERLSMVSGKLPVQASYREQVPRSRTQHAVVPQSVIAAAQARPSASADTTLQEGPSRAASRAARAGAGAQPPSASPTVSRRKQGLNHPSLRPSLAGSLCAACTGAQQAGHQEAAAYRPRVPCCCAAYHFIA